VAARPTTIFSGTTGPQGDRPGPDRIFTRLLIYVVVVLILPIAALVYAAWMALFTYARMPWWVPTPAALSATVVGLVTGKLGVQGVQDFGEGVRNLITGFSEQPLISVLHYLWGHAFLGFWGATCYAAVVCAWKWVRRPSWQERLINPGPILKKREKETEEQIAAGTDAPDGGITLGVSIDRRDHRFAGGKPGARYGDRVVISDAELAGHALVCGGSGSGKTQGMLVGIRDVIRQGRGLVFVDCKGGPDVPIQIADWCARYGREFYHWSIQDPNIPYTGPATGPAYYDPLSRGDASRRKDLLVGSQRWDVEYYKTVIGNYLQTLFAVKDLVPPLTGVDTFSDVADLLSPQQLIHRAQNIPANLHPDLAAALLRLGEMGDQEMSGIRNMYARLHTLTSSTAGAWLRRDPEGLRDINLRRVADEGRVVVFSLDTSNYEETASLIAGLIIQDLKTLSSELRNDPAPTPLHVYVDEFSAVDATNLLGLLAKARDAKMPAVLATQALADLARREPTFVDQVLGIVSAFVIHRANTEADARIYAGLSGVTRKMLERMSLEQSSGTFGTFGAASATGAGYLEERDEYAINVGTFQNLKRGQAVFIAKSPIARYVNPVKVVLENEMIADLKSDPPLEIDFEPKAKPAQQGKTTYPHPAASDPIDLFAPVASDFGQQVMEPTLPPVPTAYPEAEVPTPPAPSRPGPQRPGVPTGNPVPQVRPPGQGAPAGAPVPLPTALPPSGPGKPAGAPMPVTGSPPPPRVPRTGSPSEEWMMP